MDRLDRDQARQVTVRRGVEQGRQLRDEPLTLPGEGDTVRIGTVQGGRWIKVEMGQNKAAVTKRSDAYFAKRQRPLDRHWPKRDKSERRGGGGH